MHSFSNNLVCITIAFVFDVSVIEFDPHYLIKYKIKHVKKIIT